jgi:hypothetical protein
LFNGRAKKGKKYPTCYHWLVCWNIPHKSCGFVKSAIVCFVVAPDQIYTEKKLLPWASDAV